MTSRFDEATARRRPERGRLLTREEYFEHIAHHVGRRGADDLDWYFDEAFPLRKLRPLRDGTGPSDGSPSGWVRWLDRERQRVLDEEDREPWGEDFDFWWKTGGMHPEECPIIAEQQGDGFGVHDGNHRVAVSHYNEMKTVPCYVGYRRSGR